MKTSEILTKAADLLQTVGWCQCRLRIFDGHGNTIAYCASGAIEKASGNQNLEIASALLAFNRQIGGLDSDLIIGKWNDTNWRTKEEVIYNLRQAAEKQEEVSDQWS